MSLINDALKRALRTQKKPGIDLSTSEGMMPAPASQQPKSRRTFWLGLLLVITLIVVGKPYLGQFFKPRRIASKAASAPAATTNTAKSTNVAAKIVGMATNALAPTNATHPAGALLLTSADLETGDTNTVAARNPSSSTNGLSGVSTNTLIETTNAPEPVQPSVPMPGLALKAIIYSKTASKALINGNTVSEGDDVDGVKIVRIERDKVIVKWNGAERQLLLE